MTLGGTASGMAGSASGKVPAPGRAPKKRILYYYESARELHAKKTDQTRMNLAVRSYGETAMADERRWRGCWSLFPLHSPPDDSLFHFLARRWLSTSDFAQGHQISTVVISLNPQSTPERVVQRVPLALDPAAGAGLIRRCAARHSRSSHRRPGGSMINN